MRFASGGYVFHALNRAVGRVTLFDKSLDDAAFEKVLRQAQEQVPMLLLAFCLMPNHWHLVQWPVNDDELSAYMHGLTITHTQRWHARHHTAGTGPLYQDRFKSFPVEEDGHYSNEKRLPTPFIFLIKPEGSLGSREGTNGTSPNGINKRIKTNHENSKEGKRDIFKRAKTHSFAGFPFRVFLLSCFRDGIWY